MRNDVASTHLFAASGVRTAHDRFLAGRFVQVNRFSDRQSDRASLMFASLLQRAVDFSECRWRDFALVHAERRLACGALSVANLAEVPAAEYVAAGQLPGVAVHFEADWAVHAQSAYFDIRKTLLPVGEVGVVTRFQSWYKRDRLHSFEVFGLVSATTTIAAASTASSSFVS